MLLLRSCWILLLLLLIVVCSDAAPTHFVPGSAISQVVALRRDNFDTALQDAANPLWLLKFYAPWCGHCKRLAPVLEEVAPTVQGKLAIGTIDCTLEKKLCDAHGVRGYPALKFSVDGEVMDEYPGGRSVKDFQAFADRLSQKEIKLVTSVQQAKDVLEEQPTEGTPLLTFVAYHPSVSTEEDLSNQLETRLFGQLARKFKLYGSFQLLLAPPKQEEGEEAPPAVDPAIELGLQPGQAFVCRLEKQVPTKCFDGFSAEEDAEQSKTLEAWFTEHNMATVLQLLPHNFHRVGHAGKPLVICVVDPKETKDVATCKDELRAHAVTGPDEIKSKYRYAWFDGKHFAKFLSQFDVYDDALPQYFVLDVPTKEYWQNVTYQKDGLPKFLQAIHEGEIPSKFATKKGLEGFLEYVYRMIVLYRPWSVVVVVLVAVALGVGFLTLILGGDMADDLRPPYDPPPPRTQGDAAAAEEEEEDEEEETKKDR